MGLQLRRSPLWVTHVLLGVSAITLLAAPSLTTLLTSKIAAASGPDISKVHFLTATRYVRENDAGAIAARLITYNATTNVNFYIDGIITPVAGVDAGASGKNNHQWRLYAALPAGEHTITATVQIDGVWYEVAGQATAYSLGVPDVSYALPSAQSSVFRPSDTPVRLKIDDTFKQFRDVTFSVYAYDPASKKFGQQAGKFEVERAQCDLAKEGDYVVCDVSRANNWAPLSDGGIYGVKISTHTMAGNGVRMNMSEHWTTFSVDGTAPLIDDLRIVGATTVGDSVSATVKASDPNLKSVNFYVTRPEEDGSCSGSGEKIAEKRVTATTPGTFSATIDVSDAAFASGKYCIGAVAADEAMNASAPLSLLFTIDHTAPIATLRITSTHSPSASTPVTVEGTVDGPASLELWKDGVKVDGFTLAMVAAGQWSYRFDSGFDKGTHSLKIIATDIYGNSSSELTSPASFASVRVGAYIPPQAVRNLSLSLTPSKLSSAVVTPALPAAQIVASQQVQTPPKTDDGAILGAETKKDGTTSAATLSAPIAPSSSGWTFFGIAWYWWVALVSLLLGGGSWAITNARRQRQFA